MWGRCEALASRFSSDARRVYLPSLSYMICSIYLTLALCYLGKKQRATRKRRYTPIPSTKPSVCARVCIVYVYVHRGLAPTPTHNMYTYTPSHTHTHRRSHTIIHVLPRMSGWVCALWRATAQTGGQLCVGNILMGFHTLKSLTLWYFSILLGRCASANECVGMWACVCATRVGRMVSGVVDIGR